MTSLELGEQRVKIELARVGMLEPVAAKEPRDLLRQIPGTRFVEMRDADRCAGGAGTFIVKNREQSRQIFERKRRAIVESSF